MAFTSINSGNFSRTFSNRLNSVNLPQRTNRSPLSNFRGDSPFEISETQKENLADLKQIVEDSIDNPPTKEDIQTGFLNFQAIIADGTISDDERQLIQENAQEAISNLGLTPKEIKDIKVAIEQIITDSPFEISEAQKENLADLKQVVQDSIDNPPTREDIQAGFLNFQAIIADGTISDDERQLIQNNAQEAISNLGLTADEIEDIKLAVQQVIADSPLPKIVDRFSGMIENSGFSGFEEDDLLMRRNRRGDRRANILSRVSESDRFASIQENFSLSEDSIFPSDLISELGTMINSNKLEDVMQLRASNIKSRLGYIREQIQSNFGNILDQPPVFGGNPEMRENLIANHPVIGV